MRARLGARPREVCPLDLCVARSVAPRFARRCAGRSGLPRIFNNATQSACVALGAGTFDSQEER